MRYFRTIERVSSQKRHVLLGFLTAISAGGCATSRNISESEYPQKPIVPRSSIASTTLLSGNQIRSGPAARDAVSPTVQTVGYNDGLVIAAPVSGNFQEEQGGLSDAVDGGEQATDRRNQADTAEDISPGDASRPESDNPTVVSSASASGTQQPVDYFVSVAMFSHPKLRAARERVAAASNVAPQVSALPDPMFNNTFWPIQNQALQTAGGRVGHQFGLSQGVPWPKKLRTKAAIANREVQMAQAELDRIEREITEAVRLAYYEVWFNTRAIEIIQETRELVDDLTQVAEARYKSGGSQQDVLRAQLEADRLDDQMVTLSRQKEQAQADLATLVQQPASLMPETSEQLGLTNVPQQLDGLLTLAEQCNPELRAIAWEIQRDRQKQKLACLQKYPDLQLGLNYAIISDDANVISPVANGHDNISFTVGTTLPIWREKINAGIREASHRTNSSTQRLEAERDAIYGKLRRLMAQADALVEQQDIYTNRIIPRTEDTLKLSIADYRGKRTDFFALIETYRELLMFETQLARIEATLAGTIAQIDRTVGCPYEG